MKRKLIDFYEKERLTEEQRTTLGKLGILKDKEEITVLDLLSEIPKTFLNTDMEVMGEPVKFNLRITFNEVGGMVSYAASMPDDTNVLFSPVYFGLTPTGETVQFIDALFTLFVHLSVAGKLKQ